MRIKSFAISDIGLTRINNEDAFALMPKEKSFLLADGMGGHKAGEVASHETIAQLCTFIRNQEATTAEEWKTLLDEGIRKANQRVFELSQKDPEKAGMGTTLCVAHFFDGTLTHAHVGDSRIYRIRKGRITQLTRDHSLRDDLIASGELDESLALSFPHKNVITRAIGTQQSVKPEIHQTKVESDDMYLLCSDGLSDTLSDAQIFDIIHENPKLEDAANELVLQVKKSGGSDNITLILLKINF